ncbi:hypothetical protein [Pontibacter russatus]|uniref:hypothetical protein n=1 Tax=Pontibacter russatus TaxID=2694929 RepID=UPI00137A372F|nr:hypothetical protein [Pontibacter russatus]
MKKKLLLLALPLLTAMGCSEGNSREELQQQELEATVMAKHDSAMAQMGDIFKLRRSLQALRDTLSAHGPDSAALQALEQQVAGLEAADEAMMVWMRNYEAPDSLQHGQAMEYLQQELQKIERVQTVMDSTISAAQETYKTYEQQQ